MWALLLLGVFLLAIPLLLLRVSVLKQLRAVATAPVAVISEPPSDELILHATRE